MIKSLIEDAEKNNLSETVKNDSSIWLRALSEITGVKQYPEIQSSIERKDFWAKEHGFL